MTSEVELHRDNEGSARKFRKMFLTGPIFQHGWAVLTGNGALQVARPDQGSAPLPEVLGALLRSFFVGDFRTVTIRNTRPVLQYGIRRS